MAKLRLDVAMTERGLAEMAVSWNQGWFLSRVTKRCPTMPVPPMMPTLYFFIKMTS